MTKRRSAIAHDIVSDKEIHRSTADMIEDMKKTNIGIEYTSQPIGYCETLNGSGTRSRITIGNIKGLDKMTVVNHELGHIFADSPVQSAKRIIEKWSEEWESIMVDDPKKSGDGGYPIVDSGIRAKIQKTYWGILNTFEDQRVESWMGNMWLNNKVRFNQARKTLGDNMREDNTANMGVAFKDKEEEDYTPLQVLLATRFFQGDMVKDNNMYPMSKELLKQVEFTNDKGGILALTKFKPFIDKYIKQKLDQLLEKRREQEQAIKDRQEKQDKLEEDINSKAEADEEYDPDDDDELESQRSEINNTQEDIDTSRADEEDIQGEWQDDQCNQPWMNENYQEQEEIDKEDGDFLTSLTPEEIDSTLKEARQQGEEQLKVMKDKIVMTSNPKAPEYLKEDLDGMTRGTTDCGVPAIEIAKGMNKIFRTLSELPTDTISTEGDEVDVESFVSNKARGSNIDECLVDTKFEEGASILISVDGSGSMDNCNNSMEKARDMTATLFRSIQNVPNINLKAIVWSGHGDSEKMLVTPVNSLEETERMTSHGTFYLTPTHLAIDYSVDLIRKMKGRKKLLIFITDGYPQFYKDGRQLSQEELTKLGKKAMTRAVRYCPNIMSMLIGENDVVVDICKQIFGTRMMIVNDMNEGKTTIVRKFKRLVTQVLRR